MTEYEQVSLFFEMVNVANGTITNYMTLLFGMLVTSYLAAHRLDRVMMTLALLIYSMFSLGFCNEIFQLYSDFSRLGLKLAALGAMPDSGLGWFGPVATSPEPLKVIPYVVITMMLGAYFASMAFFFRARKANLSSDTGPVERGYRQ